MLRVMSANLNGIRSAWKKGFDEYMLASGADIICVQELKAQQADLVADILYPAGFYGYFSCAQKRGYSGVGIYSKTEPLNVQNGLGLTEFDEEGRFIRLDFPNCSVLSWYLPSGSSGDIRQEAKFRALEQLQSVLNNLIQEQKHIIICGDWNIAHQNIDLKNWKANQKNSGFLPEERTWLSEVLQDIGW